MLLILLFVINYIRIFIQDHFEEWCIRLTLMLPMRLFDQTKTIQIGFKRNIKHVWFTKVAVLSKEEQEIEYLSGPQLMCLANNIGEIPLNNLKKYYPNIQTLILNYISTNSTQNSNNDSSDDSNDDNINESNNGSDDESNRDVNLQMIPLDLVLVTKVIDIESKKDIISGNKCFLGRIQL